ncbi:hypothetical protein SH1V18_29220 [Vallitalea longa]|uniref:Uncharacterized protein n=1 Tax=Vallitalea longa TaxID=2936439 RepID=A0A9W5YAM0_9FIRM|nr:hypothetical protein [Vallitalea longa]GKX30442.1 hypothetical protein SH1V18_29220 [Vallitalea longa]
MKKISMFILIVVIILVTGCSNKKVELEEPIPEDKIIKDIERDIWVVQDDDKLVVGYRYNEKENIWIEFAKRGINELLQISNVFTTAIQDKMTKNEFDNLDKVQLIDSYTDWISPCMFRKGSQKTEDEPQFTGGWHGVDDKYETARMLDYNIEVDGNVNSNIVQVASEVVLTVTNNLYAYNTIDSKKEELQETVIYNINSDGIQVEVELKALDDIVIEKYYGLQTLNSLYRGSLIYDGAEDTAFDPFKGSESPPKSNDCSYQVTLRSEDGAHVLIASINKDVGLGKGDYLGDSIPYAFTLSYGKTYFDLVRGKELHLKKGETAKWKGRYIFKYEDINN